VSAGQRAVHGDRIAVADDMVDFEPQVGEACSRPSSRQQSQAVSPAHKSPSSNAQWLTDTLAHALLPN
jgi:hypothetical protein